LIRSFHHSDFPLARLLEEKREPVTVVLPAREVAGTIGRIVAELQALDPLIDQILVVDAGSQDGTAEIARGLGAEVHQERDLMPAFGRPLGKGDAMWRALSVARGDVIAYLDSDTREFSGHFATGMLGPLVVGEPVDFVKGTFERPFTTASGEIRPRDGGRVTELTARPLLSAFYPELAEFGQPLAGEVAGRRSLFEAIPFATGYAVEIEMLLDARDIVGVERMAQVDLEQRLNQHQPLLQLGPMAYSVLGVVLERLRQDGRLHDFPAADEVVKRPPYASAHATA
jgi:glucosyl-3-phosphoglycerate synthase